MRSAKPPRLANWLLTRCGSGPNGTSLAGDLIEQYGRGRSRAWYWRQTLRAILVGAAHDIRDHKWIAASAPSLGWLIYSGSASPVMWLSRWVGSRIDSWLDYSAASQILDIARVEILIYASCAVSGWFVARVYRAHAPGAVGLYAMTVLLFEYGHMFWMFWQHGHPPSLSLAALVLPGVFLIGRPLGILVGGLSEMRRGVHSDITTPL
jgi:hypothetical protein